MKIVWKTKVNSINFVSDFTSGLRNIIGGRMKDYEKMIDVSIKQATDELIKENPTVSDIKMQITEFSNASIAITVYGVVV